MTETIAINTDLYRRDDEEDPLPRLALHLFELRPALGSLEQ